MSPSASTAATTDRPIRPAAPHTHTLSTPQTYGKRARHAHPPRRILHPGERDLRRDPHIPQPGGAPVQLVVFGDEFYARYETLDGYTVVFDTVLGRYCYAAVAGGRFISTGVTIDKPCPPGIPTHLHESPRSATRSSAAGTELRPRVSGDLGPSPHGRGERRPAGGPARERGPRPRPHGAGQLRRPPGHREPGGRRRPPQPGGLRGQRQPRVGARLLPHDVERTPRLPQHGRGAGPAQQALEHYKTTP